MAVRSIRSSARPVLVGLGAVLSLLLVVAVSSPARAAVIGLGQATSFAVLAGTGVSNTGPSVITGNVGASPTPTVIGFPPATLVGSSLIYPGAPAAIPKDDLTTAYNDAADPIGLDVTAELGGTSPVPGTYNGELGYLQITGDLTLDAGDDPDATWIFQAESTLITASSSRVLLENGASACNVFWQIGSSATLGTGSLMVGTVMALTSITATTQAEVAGRLLARNGAVTLDSNVITLPEECVDDSDFPAEGGVPESPVDGEGPGGPGDGGGSGGPASPTETGLPPTGSDAALPLLAGAAAVALGGVLMLRHRSQRRTGRT